jgi:hypothetical protein
VAVKATPAPLFAVAVTAGAPGGMTEGGGDDGDVWHPASAMANMKQMELRTNDIGFSLVKLFHSTCLHYYPLDSKRQTISESP